MSYQAVASGMLATACAAIKNSLDGLTEMCGNTTINVGFVTFDSAVHFYQLREGHPVRQLVVGEVDEPFLPVPSTLLVNLVDARSAVEAFLDALPAAHAAWEKFSTFVARGDVHGQRAAVRAAAAAGLWRQGDALPSAHGVAG